MSKAKLGSGARFASLEHKLSARGATNPGALAAYIGREKYGAHRMADLAAKGHRDATRHTAMRQAQHKAQGRG